MIKDKIERMKLRATLASGKEPVSLVLKNCRIINVFNGRIISSNIAIDHGKIIGIGNYEGVETIDLNGMFVAPGLQPAATLDHWQWSSRPLHPRSSANRSFPNWTANPSEGYIRSAGCCYRY